MGLTWTPSNPPAVGLAETGKAPRRLARPRDRLIDAATAAVLPATGVNFGSASTRSVEAAGTAKTTLYKVFGSKGRAGLKRWCSIA